MARVFDAVMLACAPCSYGCIGLYMYACITLDARAWAGGTGA
jgi:hypothetical protein